MKKIFILLLPGSVSGFIFLLAFTLPTIAFGQKDVTAKTFEIKKSNTVTMKAIMQGDKQRQSPEMLRSAKERKNKVEEFEKDREEN
jgi:hypothetical protein